MERQELLDKYKVERAEQTRLEVEAGRIRVFQNMAEGIVSQYNEVLQGSKTMTPEGKVKKAVKAVLAEFGDDIDGFWPVPSGYGESHLDYVGSAWGFFLSIETKAPGGKPSPRQIARIRTVELSGGLALVIDGTDKTVTYDQLRTELMVLRERRKLPHGL